MFKRTYPQAFGPIVEDVFGRGLPTHPLPAHLGSFEQPKSPRCAGTKRCAECGATETPQWRQGPTGPQTLCNACGVRYSRHARRSRGTKKKGVPHSMHPGDAPPEAEETNSDEDASKGTVIHVLPPALVPAPVVGPVMLPTPKPKVEEENRDCEAALNLLSMAAGQPRNDADLDLFSIVRGDVLQRLVPLLDAQQLQQLRALCEAFDASYKDLVAAHAARDAVGRILAVKRDELREAESSARAVAHQLYAEAQQVSKHDTLRQLLLRSHSRGGGSTPTSYLRTPTSLQQASLLAQPLLAAASSSPSSFTTTVLQQASVQQPQQPSLQSSLQQQQHNLCGSPPSSSDRTAPSAVGSAHTTGGQLCVAGSTQQHSHQHLEVLQVFECGKHSAEDSGSPGAQATDSGISSQGEGHHEQHQQPQQSHVQHDHREGSSTQVPSAAAAHAPEASAAAATEAKAEGEARAAAPEIPVAATGADHEMTDS